MEVEKRELSFFISERKKKERRERKERWDTFVVGGWGWEWMGWEDMEVWEVLYLGLKSPQPNLSPNQNQNQNQIYAFIISFPFLTFWVGDAFN